MNVWEILQIESTRDIKTIKKAYILLSKQYHPEDNLEQFSLIKRAYDEAIKIARKENNVKYHINNVEEHNINPSMIENDSHISKTHTINNKPVIEIDDVEINHKKNVENIYLNVHLDVSSDELKNEKRSYQFNLNNESTIEQKEKFVKMISTLPVVAVNKKGAEKDMVKKWRDFLDSDEFASAIKDTTNLKIFVNLVKKIEDVYPSAYYHIAVTCVARYIDHPQDKKVANILRPYFKEELKVRVKNRQMVLGLAVVILINVIIILL